LKNRCQRRSDAEQAALVEQGVVQVFARRRLGVQPDGLHQRIGLVFGSKHEVERIERYHAEPPARKDLDNPLFHERSLFRV